MRKAVILLLMVAFACHCSAKVIYVDASGPNDPGTGVYTDPFRRVQDAIESADEDDIVEIRPGIYTGSGNYNLTPSVNITIRSIDPNDHTVVAATVINPNGAGRGFCFNLVQSSDCIVSGLTVSGGYSTESGGGIFCSDSSPTISRCIITGNEAELYGGGVFCDSSNCQIVSCTISNNSAQDGGGLECWGDSPVIDNCIISNNSVSDWGGGVDCWYGASPKLTNCTVVGNIANNYGGALCCYESQALVISSIFASNKAPDGSQIALLAFGGGGQTSTASVSYSDIQGGQSTVYVGPDCNLVWDSNSIIDAVPDFAIFDPNGDPNTWDFHLQSAYGRWDSNSQSWVPDTNTSLCIDAGKPNSDWGTEPWPNGKCINIGAYGGTAQASKNGNLADFNVDEVVNLPDYIQLASKWMLEQHCIEDLSIDGIVDFADLAVFVDNWLWVRP